MMLSPDFIHRLRLLGGAIVVVVFALCLSWVGPA